MRGKLALGAGIALPVVLWSMRSAPEHATERTSVEPVLAPEREAVQDGLPTSASPRPLARTPAVVSEAPPPAPTDPSGHTLSGTVLDPDGRPPHFASVRFVWDDRGRMREVHGWVARDGSFALDVGHDVVGDLLACEVRHEWAPAARCGVRAGTSGIELRLGPRSFFELEVRDEREQPLAVSWPRFHWELSGYKVLDYPGSHEPRWARSPVPFFVSVTGGWFGPFAPAQVGERLVLRVEPKPVLRGRVMHEGVPVANARVQRIPVPAADEERLPDDEPLPSETMTDAEGRFASCPLYAARFELIAFAAPHGEGRLGPVEFDGVNDVTGLEIELTRKPGTIVGQVTLPAGHRAEELWLRLDDRARYRPLRPDGSFSLPDLPPGARQIHVLAGYGLEPEEEPAGESWISRMHGPTRAPAWLRPDPCFTVGLAPGETLRIDLDLASRALCSLEGEILLDGQPRNQAKRRSAMYEPDTPQVTLDRGSRATTTSLTDLDGAGRFTLAAREPDTYRLSVAFGIDGAKEERWQVLDRVTLRAGVLPWSLAVRTGSLRLLPSDEAHPLWSVSPYARWRGPGELRVTVGSAELDEERGTRLYRCLPAGKVTLFLDRRGEAPRELECEIRAGETTEVVWPW